MTEPALRAIQVEQRIGARPETVFTYFTDQRAYRRWMGERAELDARPGGIYRVRFEDGSVVEGRFEEVEPPYRIVFTWGWVDSEALPPGSSRVEVSLIADGDGTVVRLEHRGLPPGSSLDEHEKGWRHYLGRMTIVDA